MRPLRARKPEGPKLTGQIQLTGERSRTGMAYLGFAFLPMSSSAASARSKRMSDA